MKSKHDYVILLKRSSSNTFLTKQQIKQWMNVFIINVIAFEKSTVLYIMTLTIEKKPNPFT